MCIFCFWFHAVCKIEHCCDKKTSNAYDDKIPSCVCGAGFPCLPTETCRTNPMQVSRCCDDRSDSVDLGGSCFCNILGDRPCDFGYACTTGGCVCDPLTCPGGCTSGGVCCSGSNFGCLIPAQGTCSSCDTLGGNLCSNVGPGYGCFCSKSDITGMYNNSVCTSPLVCVNGCCCEEGRADSCSQGATNNCMCGASPACSSTEVCASAMLVVVVVVGLCLKFFLT